jgi:PST family polysaccharide transporter
MREGRLSSTAMIGGAQVVAANLATAVLVLLWPSALAIILPKLFSAPIWLVGMRRLRPWRADPMARPAPVRPFIGFGAAVLGGEIVKALCLQADKLVIGALLGAEALGVYFFAFNAGLGIATSFSRAFAIVLFPHLCAAADRERALGSALKTAVVILAPVVLLQAALAPFYVPVLFGERWGDAAGVVSILCLAAIPSLIWSAAGQWLRARDQAGLEFAATSALAVGLIGSTVLLAPHGLVATAWGYLAVSTFVQIAASLPALRAAFQRSDRGA